MDMEIYKMIYRFETTSKFQILGEEFMEKNSNKGKLNINNKKFHFNEVSSLDLKKQTKIKLILSGNIFNKSCMFKNCKNLESLLKLSNNNNVDYINDIDYIINEDCQPYKNKRNSFYNNDNDSFFEDDEDISLYNNLSYKYSEISNKKSERIDDVIILYFYDKLKYLGNNYTILKDMFYNCE